MASLLVLVLPFEWVIKRISPYTLSIGAWYNFLPDNGSRLPISFMVHPSQLTFTLSHKRAQPEIQT